MNAFLCYRHFYGEDAMWDFINNGSDMFSKSIKWYFRQFNEVNDFPIGIYDESKANDIAIISYLKPHFIMAMLMETIGYNNFSKGLKRIVSEYSTDKRLDIGAIKQIMEQESGQNLDDFFNQWFYRAGAPEFEIEHNVTRMQDGRFRIDGQISQLREIFIVNAEIELSNKGQMVQKKIEINDREEKFSYILDFRPSLVKFDPHHKILRWSKKSKQSQSVK